MVPGVEAVARQSDEDEADDTVVYVQGVEPRTFPIGRTLDTSDDKARLMLVTHYAGSRLVNVYNAGSELETGTKAGYLTIEDAETVDVADVNNVALKSEGMYYPAGQAGQQAEGNLVYNGDVDGEAKPKEVFSYKDVRRK